jgi:hypothetical protein
MEKLYSNLFLILFLRQDIESNAHLRREKSEDVSNSVLYNKITINEDPEVDFTF